MKRKDYVRLSKISLKARKKTTRSTVRGISFGMILLMPLLFIVIAFHIDLNKEVNKDASIRVFNITFTSQTTDDNYVTSVLDTEKDKVFEKISKAKNEDNKITLILIILEINYIYFYNLHLLEE